VDGFGWSGSVFELGEYGGPVPVFGLVISSQGAPIPNASVYLEGQVTGNGTLRTSSVLTNSAGVFTLSTLRNSADTRFTLWAVPPTQSNSGILYTPVRVTGAGSVGSFSCPDRIPVRGLVHRPDGAPGVGVRVNAEPVALLGSYPLPPSSARATSDANGSFSLKLDPAIYRLDFIPGEQLPRASRYIIVEGQGIDSLTITLSNGRRLIGAVSSRINSGNNSNAVPFGSVRFFRVATVSGDLQSSELIAETVSDESGNYAVILPLR
jgi:hypothetical protein